MAGVAGATVAGWLGLNLYAALKIARGGTDTVERRDPGSLGLAFTDVSYGPGLPAWYVPGAPGRPVVVLVHGYGGNRTDALEVGPPLHDRGYGLLFVNLGYVSGARLYGGGQREAADVADAATWVRDTTGAPAVLLGFSGGALASLGAAARGAPVVAVISDSGFVGFRDVVAFRAHVPDGFTNLLPVIYPAVSGGGHVIDLAHEIGDRPFRAPALVIQGGADATVPPSDGERLARLTGGRLWLLPGVGHTRAFERDRAAYVDRVDAFIGAAVA